MAAGSGIDRLKERTGITQAPKTLANLVDSLGPRLQRVAAKHMNADRLLQIALNMTKDPEIAACTQQSLLGCVMMSAITGLEPGVFGQCYYIRYGNTLTFVPGWQGYADLVARTGRGEAWTGAVYQGDKFAFSLGSRPFLDHEPSEELTEADVSKGRPLTHCYAVGYSKGSDRPIIEVWPIAKIKAHRDRYNKVGAKHYSFKNLHNLEMYGRKVAFLQVIKYLPKSAEIQQVAGLDFQADAGTQSITPEIALGETLPELPTDTGTVENKTESKVQVNPRFAEVFDLLGWNVSTQANWFKANDTLGEAEQIAKLESELDK